MNSMLWLILVSLTLGGGALALFLWALRSGQYEDLEGAAQRVLFDDVATPIDPDQRKAVPAPPV